jgi:hypothetical protein
MAGEKRRDFLRRLTGRRCGLLGTTLVASLWVGADPAAACICDPISVAEAVEEVDSVFLGSAVSVEVLASAGLGGRPPSLLSTSHYLRWGFEVSHVWKGSTADTIYVHSEESEISCGFEFEVGERYLVYAASPGTAFWQRRTGASPEPSALVTGLCRRTILIDGAGEDLRALPPPIHVRSGSDPPLTIMINSLLSRLGDESEARRAAAARELVATGEELDRVLPAISVLLERGTVHDRRTVVVLLHDLGSEAIIVLPELTRALEDEDEYVRYWSRRALERIPAETRRGVNR